MKTSEYHGDHTGPCSGPGCHYCLSAAQQHLHEAIEALAGLEQYGDQDDEDEMWSRLAAVHEAQKCLAALQTPTIVKKER